MPEVLSAFDGSFAGGTIGLGVNNLPGAYFDKI
jgi:hypothetical protein